MRKKYALLFSIGAMVAGWILNAFAWVATFGPRVSTTCLLLGLGLFFSGIISLILALSQKNPVVEKRKEL